MTTITEDPIDRFTFLTEEVRRVRDARHGVAAPVVLLMCELFLVMLRRLARLAEQVRDGTLPVTAPADAPDQPRAWPPDLRPRQSSWLEQDPEAAAGGGTMHGQFEQPEMAAEINQPIAEPPCQMPVVEEAAARSPPRRARVRKLKNSSGSALTQPRHADDGCWPQWHGPGILWTTDTGFLRFESKKWV